jgi:hypothetical protein
MKKDSLLLAYCKVCNCTVCNAYYAFREPACGIGLKRKFSLTYFRENLFSFLRKFSNEN